MHARAIITKNASHPVKRYITEFEKCAVSKSVREVRICVSKQVKGSTEVEGQ